jgi:hypothetical protein
LVEASPSTVAGELPTPIAIFRGLRSSGFGMLTDRTPRSNSRSPLGIEALRQRDGP